VSTEVGNDPDAYIPSHLLIVCGLVVLVVRLFERGSVAQLISGTVRLHVIKDDKFKQIYPECILTVENTKES
jgi:hypothetical protein